MQCFSFGRSFGNQCLPFCFIIGFYQISTTKMYHALRPDINWFVNQGRSLLNKKYNLLRFVKGMRVGRPIQKTPNKKKVERPGLTEDEVE